MVNFFPEHWVLLTHTQRKNCACNEEEAEAAARKEAGGTDYGRNAGFIIHFVPFANEYFVGSFEISVVL